LVGFAVVLGAIAFDKHGDASLAKAGTGGKRNNSLLETTPKAAYDPSHY
jgi:hypothetical protein